MQFEPIMGALPDLRDSWKKEQLFYERTGVLPMTKPYHVLYEEEIQQAYKQSSKSKIEQAAVIARTVDANWAPNVTFIDLEWLRNRPRDDALDIELADDPWHFGASLGDFSLPVAANSRLMDQVSAWFTVIASCLKDLQSCIMIEACLGDVTAVLEQIRHGVVGDHSSADLHSPQGPSPEGVTATVKLIRSCEAVTISDLTLDSTVYDIKHQYAQRCQRPAENIRLLLDKRLAVDRKSLRDLGVQGKTVLLGATILGKPDTIQAPDPEIAVPEPISAKETAVTDAYPGAYDRQHPGLHRGKFVVLPLRAAYDIPWRCLYTGLSTSADLAKVFQVRSSGSHSEGYQEYLRSLPQPMPMNDYHYWHHHEESPSKAGMMPRDKLGTWLHRLFLKLCLPVHKESIQNFVLIFDPLSLAVFFHVLGHLHNVGYPAHWLNDVMGSLLRGKINSSARAPRSGALKIRETAADMSLLEQSVKPSVAELSTLAGIWRSPLPFGITSQLPPLDGVRKYTFTFGDVLDFVGNIPVFVLAFFDSVLLPPQSISRPFLLGDERADGSPRARKARDAGMHIVSTWEWSRATKSATFWLRKDVMDVMKRGPWAVAI